MHLQSLFLPTIAILEYYCYPEITFCTTTQKVILDDMTERETILRIAASRAVEELPERIRTILDQAGQIKPTAGELVDAIDHAITSKYAPQLPKTIYTMLPFEASA